MHGPPKGKWIKMDLLFKQKEAARGQITEPDPPNAVCVRSHPPMSSPKVSFKPHKRRNENIWLCGGLGAWHRLYYLTVHGAQYEARGPPRPWADHLSHQGDLQSFAATPSPWQQSTIMNLRSRLASVIALC